jgi:1-deoxy-D-xylulose 5-phosphate reductoisomerase
VSRFLDGRIGFPSIPRIIAETMDVHRPAEVSTLVAVRAVDRWARGHAEEVARGLELRV